ncbi:type IV toxin-antitoxin system AbiEi family antitoxin domain-containing protein [Agromyces subbeticus]|uniref:type IV toxin-antitoxin system AbiEi family antitoxin domain-containing protein n=1 Tax=Agromyces subbeticus TaxID=293890 RepID=UPI00040DABF9|nr:type IV toxin-antitoxin system AbiEi family antitoxin domain-containing protein [Agromyces subbeticus]
MTDARTVVRAHGGVCTTAQLLASGISRRSITAAVDHGGIECPRRGVFVERDAPPAAKRAVRVGGRLACVSAARLHGLRVLNEPGELHVHVGAHATRLRDPDARFTPLHSGDTRVRLHWERLGPASGLMVPLEACLAEMLACTPEIDALVALDSARERVEWRPERPQLLDDHAFDRLLDRLPASLQRVAERSCTSSQAVAETVARERFRVGGIPAKPQAALPGGFWADFLIGERLIFEVDGEGPHTAPGAFDRDRGRWAWVKAIGYAHVSFSHRQVLHDWESVESVVRMLMARGAHLAPAAVRSSGFAG